MKASTKKIIKKYSIQTAIRAYNMDDSGFLLGQIEARWLDEDNRKDAQKIIDAAKDFIDCVGESFIYKRFDMESPVHIVSDGCGWSFMQSVQGTYTEYHQMQECENGYYTSLDGYHLGSKSFLGYTKAEAIEKLTKLKK